MLIPNISAQVSGTGWTVLRHSGGHPLLSEAPLWSGIEYLAEEGFLLFPNRSDAELRRAALMRHYAVGFAVFRAKWRHRLTSRKEYIGGATSQRAAETVLCRHLTILDQPCLVAAGR